VGRAERAQAVAPLGRRRGDRHRAGPAALARRAKDAGDLRPDFVVDDLILILMANRGIRATSPAAAVAASRRFAALAIQALQASPESRPLPPAARLSPVVLLPPHRL
jgi:hypothetical protein